MARVVLYDESGAILQITEGSAASLAATAAERDVSFISIPEAQPGLGHRDFYLDSKFKVVEGLFVEIPE
ncbi:MAG: hypothetical protein EON59_03265 [Alphaproteobacteria bacterium]|nr:MAG: hypothetical protein EON59_03265 [Alphaproteobacteria bacterium]